MAGPRHLDAASLAALLERPAGDPELLAHLEAPCEVCEAFLAGHPGPGLLDGAVDAALTRAQPDAPLHEAGLARVLGALRPRPPRRRARWALGGAVALAAMALVVVVGTRDREGGEGLKGTPAEVLELSAVHQAPDGALVPVGSGGTLKAEGALVFRVRSPRAGTGLLLVQRGSAAPEALATVQVPAGRADLRGPDGLLGLSLEGESGEVLVWLIVRDGPTAPSLETARGALHSPGARGVAVGRFELRVVP